MNLATEYGITIEPIYAAGPHWRVKTVRHLSPSENRGKHHLYVDVMDSYGLRVFDDRLRIAWLTHEGDSAADYTRLDKPDSPIELGDGNVGLSTSMTLTAWIHDGVFQSERVTGIHTRHPDERGPAGQLWNSYGHHSFYVCFERIEGAVLPPTDPPADADLTARVERLERTMAGMVAGWGA